MSEQIVAPTVEELLGEKFTPISHRQLGAMATSHLTRFGLIDGEQVAAKVFFSKSAHQKAHREEKLTKHIAEIGYQTIEPLDVIGPITVESDKKRHAAVLISRYVPNLIAAHTLSYSHEPGTIQEIAMRKPVESIARTLSGLHSDNVTHGDAQLRNFGFKAAYFGGYVAPVPIVYDLESGMTHKVKPGIGSEMYQNLAQKDLGTLMLSLGDRHYGGENDKDAGEIAREAVVDTYMSRYHGAHLSSLVLGQMVDFAQDEFQRGRHNNRPSLTTEQK